MPLDPRLDEPGFDKDFDDAVVLLCRSYAVVRAALRIVPVFVLLGVVYFLSGCSA